MRERKEKRRVKANKNLPAEVRGEKTFYCKVSGHCPLVLMTERKRRC
jgi:hypothetical protein